MSYIQNGSAGGGGGTVTAVTASAPLASSGGNTPDISGPTLVTSAAALTANRLVIGGGSQASAVLGSLGTTTTLLHGNAAGAPTFGAVVNADITSLDAATKLTGVVPPANGGVGVSSTASRDYYLLPFGTLQIASSAANSAAMTANTMKVFQFNLDRTVTFTRGSINIVTTSNANHEYMGIYDAVGTTLIRQITFTLGAGTGVLLGATVAATTLVPGTYWLARSADNATSVLSGTATTQTTGLGLLNGGAIVRWGNSDQVSAAGALPATIGTVTAATIQAPMMLLEP